LIKALRSPEKNSGFVPEEKFEQLAFTPGPRGLPILHLSSTYILLLLTAFAAAIHFIPLFMLSR
jgi:hypothetical protein